MRGRIIAGIPNGPLALLLTLNAGPELTFLLEVGTRTGPQKNKAINTAAKNQIKT